MAKFSRVHVGQRSKTPAELHAPRGADADEPIRRRESGRCGCWPAMGFALLALVSAGARGQQASSAPVGDIYDSGGGGPVYSDIYESNCESASTSPFKGMDPRLCHGVEGTIPPGGGSCGPNHPPLKLWKQVGSSCLWCNPVVPPLTNAIVIPIDDLGAAVAQGFKCGGGNDLCTVVCTGNGKFKPPPGTSLQPTKGTTPQPLPGTPRQTAKKVPQPTSGSKTPIDTLWGPFECPKPNPNGPKFDLTQISILNKDLAAAKAMVAKVKTYTDKNPWDAGTQAISTKWFGNATPATQKVIRQDVNNVLKLLNGIKSVTSAIYPTGADLFAPTDAAECGAYVHPALSNGTEIFLCDPFWKAPETGPDSQPPILVHELSHLPNGARTVDVAYGQTDCKDLVFMTSNWIGQIFWAPWYKMPQTGKGAADPLTNADSFEYFVYDVANQK